MPIWALGLAGLLAFGGAAGLALQSRDQGPVPTYAAPSSAPSPTLPQPMPLAVFLGDSYTQGAGGGGVRWPDLVAEKYGWDVLNLGLGGTGYIATSSMSGCGRQRCGTYLEASQEIMGNPRVIIVSGGRNDLRFPVPDIATAAEELFSDLQERFPEAQIFVINPWFDDDDAPASLGSVATALRQVAPRHGVTAIDTGLVLEGREELISEDGVHPNAAGYRALALATITQLDSLLAE